MLVELVLHHFSDVKCNKDSTTTESVTSSVTSTKEITDSVGEQEKRSCTQKIMEIINRYRKMGGLNELLQDDKLS